jgi:hypothetical protein
MRTERRKSGSARGDEKLAAEKRYGAHRLLKASFSFSMSDKSLRHSSSIDR